MTEVVSIFRMAEDMQRETENVVNRLHRHCRIGRVTKKFMTHGGKMVPMRWMPDPMKPPPTPSFSGGYVPVTSSGDVPLVPSHGVLM
ncbi:hypothetical protein [Shinella granuli]|uniref:Uncharacterized protein n=1 Tax=Shinella granuli TaxID=323621 RepID=A0A4R2BYK7_SHIGR|nr:hypothetical protein [Shinella granuli]TCN32971.1 hypothetical protein EV665_14314 [Shinella granuli]